MVDRRLPITEPTGLRRHDAALHCGVSPAHFDKLVNQGVMPGPRDMSGVNIWIRQELDAALYAIEPGKNFVEEAQCDAVFDLA